MIPVIIEPNNYIIDLIRYYFQKLDLKVPSTLYELIVEGSTTPLNHTMSIQMAIDKQVLLPDSKLILHELPIKFPLPIPIQFTKINLYGIPLYETYYTINNVRIPYFLQDHQYKKVIKFIREIPDQHPQMLMLTGTIKCGKTSLLNTIIPGLIANEVQQNTYPQGKTPIIFQYSFTMEGHNPANEGLVDLLKNLKNLAMKLNVPFANIPSVEDILSLYPGIINDFAKEISRRNGVLWLLIDEIQNPLIYSIIEEDRYNADPVNKYKRSTLLDRFMASLKTLLEFTSSTTRIVITGSGLLTLLSTIPKVQMNGFVLGSAIQHVVLGPSPPTQTIDYMTEKIIESCPWSKDVKQYVLSRIVEDLVTRKFTYQNNIDRNIDMTTHDSMLSSTSNIDDTNIQGVRANNDVASSNNISTANATINDNITSPRPALVAYLAGEMKNTDGSVEKQYQNAWNILITKIKMESEFEATVALSRFPIYGIHTLYNIVHNPKYRTTKFTDEIKAYDPFNIVGTFIDYLSEQYDNNINILYKFRALRDLNSINQVPNNHPIPLNNRITGTILQPPYVSLLRNLIRYPGSTSDKNPL